MFMKPSISCCKIPSPSFLVAKRCTLPRRDNASLTCAGATLLFVNVQEISFSSKSEIPNLSLLFQEYVLKEKE